MENFGDDSLKCGRSSLETKHHDYRDEYSPVCDEGLLLLAEAIGEAIDVMVGHGV